MFVSNALKFDPGVGAKCERHCGVTTIVEFELLVAAVPLTSLKPKPLWLQCRVRRKCQSLCGCGARMNSVELVCFVWTTLWVTPLCHKGLGRVSKS